MRRVISSLSVFMFAAILQGCSGSKDSESAPSSESNAVTQTRMDNIDNLEGTISDEMIITDDATDESSLESTDSAAKTGDAAGSDKEEATTETGDE